MCTTHALFPTLSCRTPLLPDRVVTRTTTNHNHYIVEEVCDQMMSFTHMWISVQALIIAFSPSIVALSTKILAGRKVVIVGGGIGGLSCAFDCKHFLDSNDHVTVISERDHFEFTPSNPCKPKLFHLKYT